jgi:glucose/arabinose dehydrogenase
MGEIDFNSKRSSSSLAGAIATLFIFFSASAQPDIYLKTVISSDLTAPIHMAHAGDGTDRIFVAERGGVIKVFSSTYTYIGIYLDISSRVSTAQEGALLSIAFHPGFETNGAFFVHFSDRFGNIVVSRYVSSVSSNNTMNDVSPVDILTISHPGTNHYGGEMHFSSDGNLYVSVGDGGGSNDANNNAQNVNTESDGSLLGKILRITPATSGTETYIVPLDNPFPANLSLDRNEIFAIGLRNPFRWSFDRSNGNVWIGDVGQYDREEIDYVAAGSFKGANFAWRCYEGAIRNPMYAGTEFDSECGSYSNFSPLYDYSRASGSVSVVGGVVYRGTKYPQMAGYYIGSDYYTGAFHVLAPSATTLSLMDGLANKTGITDFGESEDGDIFAVSMSENKIFRFADANVEPLPVTLVDFQGRFMNEGVKLSWKSSLEKDFRHFEVEHSTDARSFTKLGVVESSNHTGGSTYQYVHQGVVHGNHYYRLKMVDVDETFGYSRMISVQVDGGLTGFVYPSVIRSGTMSVNLAQGGDVLEVINTSGHVLMRSDVGGKIGKVDVPVHHLAAGLYIARLRGEGVADIQQKVVIVP